MALNFHTLDVFTDQRFGGNPLAVVHDADGLSTEQMQAIAREFNLSETVFVLKSQNAAHSARMRIFTPVKELPFAGHPTVGTAALLAELKAPVQNGERDALVVLEQGIGTVRVGVRLRAGSAAYAEFDAPKLPSAAGALPEAELLAAGLGLNPNEIGFENHKPVCFAAGTAFAFIPVTTLEAIGRARVNGSHWERAFDEQGIVGAYLYTRQCVSSLNSFHVRMFAPSVGIPEDPATGSGAVCFAGVIYHFDQLPDGTHRRLVEQGIEMGRPSTLSLTLSVDRGQLATVRIGGSAVQMTKGTIEV
jgi:trans-2,3-dihydro-3-hydroxyanthranilate isomerase